MAKLAVWVEVLMGKVLDAADIAAILETPAPAKSTVRPAVKATAKSADKLAPSTRSATRAKHPDMESELIDRIEKETNKSLPALAREGHPILSGRSLVKIANEILGATEESGVGKGWATNFRERNRIRAKDIAEQDGEDEEKDIPDDETTFAEASDTGGPSRRSTKAVVRDWSYADSDGVASFDGNESSEFVPSEEEDESDCQEVRPRPRGKRGSRERGGEPQRFSEQPPTKKSKSTDEVAMLKQRVRDLERGASAMELARAADNVENEKKIEKALRTVIAKLRPVLIKMLEQNNTMLNARTDKKIEAANSKTKKTLDARTDKKVEAAKKMLDARMDKKIEAANSKTKETHEVFQRPCSTTCNSMVPPEDREFLKAVHGEGDDIRCQYQDAVNTYALTCKIRDVTLAN
ncbi:NAD binding dehydrogenase [Phytophthora cinnamomi]|uniref:NAD binding dehydrogenase n=1 Tax=Phytophthora cinnamomi TaxID=4785 RepID=UPI00355A60CA|nr:NAD binding dehydrogenase [Phytophthora cinnamomi]